MAKDGHIYLLSGLLKCDCCYNPSVDISTGRMGWHGEVKDLKKSGKKAFYYKCGKKNSSKTSIVCKSIPLPADAIENYIIEYSKNLLKNPIEVFEHQKNLQSRTNTTEFLRKKDAALLDLITGVPRRKKRLREQHEANLIGIVALKEQAKIADDDLHRYTKERDEVQMQIAQHSLSKGYINALDLFSEKYDYALEKGFKDRNTLYSILHELIDEVVIYSRPLKKTDVVAGRRKIDQQIPDRIHIKLKLPQEILNRIGTQKVLLTEYVMPDSDQSSGQKSVSGAGNDNLFKLFDTVSLHYEKVSETVKELNDFLQKERLEPAFAVNL